MLQGYRVLSLQIEDKQEAPTLHDKERLVYKATAATDFWFVLVEIRGVKIWCVVGGSTCHGNDNESAHHHNQV